MIRLHYVCVCVCLHGINWHPSNIYLSLHSCIIFIQWVSYQIHCWIGIINLLDDISKRMVFIWELLGWWGALSPKFWKITNFSRFFFFNFCEFIYNLSIFIEVLNKLYFKTFKIFSLAPPVSPSILLLWPPTIVLIEIAYFSNSRKS